MDHGSLRFFGADGRPSGAVIREDGTYQIDLLPGQYQVGVSSPPKLPPGHREGDPPPPPDPDALPARYSQPGMSGLSITVETDAPAQTIHITLE